MKPNKPTPSKKDLLLQFESVLKQLPHIINYMQSYPELAEKIGIHKKLTYNDVLAMYSSWLHMYKLLDNKKETDFYQPHWFRLSDLFIDLSDQQLPMFFANFLGFENGIWVKNPVTSNIHDFLIKLDDPNFNLSEHFLAVNNNLINLAEELASKDKGYEDYF